MTRLQAPSLAAVALCGIAILAPGSAIAGTGGPSGNTAAKSTEVAQSSPPPAIAAKILDDALLSQQRGGQAITIGKQTLTSVVTGNSIGGSYTAGAISLSDSAFSNFSGIGNVVINTGAQANLQSAMNVTVNLGN